jgi:serine/threonine-protein kinase
MTPPSSIAHYKITTKLGEGGMGAVYRATDTKLARDVAIKVLPDSVVHDVDRLARFTREAQVLASLNHPNIAGIYGVEDRALILELVEGPTLAERLAQGPIPMEEALPIARQIADAMEFAHERGIIHRDLKPANIKIRDDGTVKVLDFGLAKALSPEVVNGSSDAMNSPTLTARATQIGVILGTAAYMAPEQAKGKSLDRRADIWAFGVVVFEMLTGKRGYQADDVSDTLAAVLTREVDWTALPADTPPRLRTLLRDCLARDPKQRLRDIGEARRVLDQLISGAPDSNAAASSANVAAPPHSPVWRRALPWTIAALAVVAAVVMLLQRPGTNAGGERELRLQMVMPGDTNSFAISPDGRSFAFSATAANGNGVQLWLRPLDSEVAKPLAGTESSFIPFWSPDSKSIGFFSHQAMKLLDVESGAVRTLARRIVESGRHDSVFSSRKRAVVPNTRDRRETGAGDAAAGAGRQPSFPAVSARRASLFVLGARSSGCARGLRGLARQQRISPNLRGRWGRGIRASQSHSAGARARFVCAALRSGKDGACRRPVSSYLRAFGRLGQLHARRGFEHRAYRISSR